MVPGALLGAVSCGRCGHREVVQDACQRCATRWTPAAPATMDRRGPAPLTGVVQPSRGRRTLAHLVDLLLPLALVTPAVAAAAAGPVPGSIPSTLLGSAAVVLVVVQAVAVTVRGTSAGRWLLGLRTVDELSGTPVGPGRLVRRLVRTGRADLLTADLRRGRDPVEPWLVTGATAGPPVHEPLPVPTARTPAATLAASAVPAAAAPTAATAVPATSGVAQPSVGIVLEGGQRHEVVDSLLIGRSPADPTTADRALLAWPDLSRRLAKTHVLLEWSGQVLSVTDLGSATGTAVVTASGGRQPLVPGVRTSVTPGAVIVCGGRSIKVVPHG